MDIADHLSGHALRRVHDLSQGKHLGFCGFFFAGTSSTE
jgi:hypothetical protein